MRDARLLCAGLSGGHRLPGRDPPLLLGRRGDAIRRGPAGRLLLRGARPDAIAAQRAGCGESGVRIVARHARLLPDAVRDRRAHHARAPRRPGARRCAARPLVPHRLRGVRRAAAGGHAALSRAVAPGAPHGAGGPASERAAARGHQPRRCGQLRGARGGRSGADGRVAAPDQQRRRRVVRRGRRHGVRRRRVVAAGDSRDRHGGDLRRAARAPSASSRRPITGSICSSRPTTPGWSVPIAGSSRIPSGSRGRCAGRSSMATPTTSRTSTPRWRTGTRRSRTRRSPSCPRAMRSGRRCRPRTPRHARPTSAPWARPCRLPRRRSCIASPRSGSSSMRGASTTRCVRCGDADASPAARAARPGDVRPRRCARAAVRRPRAAAGRLDVRERRASARGSSTRSGCRHSATPSTRTVDPRAQQPELAGGTEAQHQVGNDSIVAAAFNHGYTQLWSQDRLQQWANRWDQPETRHYAGGFGWLHRRRDGAEHALPRPTRGRDRRARLRRRLLPQARGARTASTWSR